MRSLNISTYIYPARRHQTIDHDGLASDACESRPARALSGVAVVLDVLVCYLFVTEVGVESRLRYITT